MGKVNKFNSLSHKKASTPQPQKKAVIAKIKKTPKSEPQPKHKKIAQEIDEAISDEEFEMTTKDVKELEKLKRKQGTITPKPISPKKLVEDDSEEDSDDEEDDLDLEDVDLDSDDIDISDEDEEDSEDAEDSDDDDSEGVEDAGIGKSKLAAKFKEIMEAEGELDSSDEDDDDADEEDSMESSEDEEEPPPTKKKKVQNSMDTQKGNKVQSKEIERKKENKAQVKESGQAQKRKREVTTNGAVSKEDLEQDRSAQDDRDSRTLFIKQTGEMHEKKIHKLLDETLREAILDVRIQSKGRAKKGVRCSHVYVEFESKQQAVAAHSQLKGKNVFVDFVGQSSNHPEKSKRRQDPEDFDPLRLYITGFQRKTTLDQLKKVFPTAAVQLPIRKKVKKNIGYAFAQFETPEECKKVHNSSGLMCNGRKLVILYAKKLTVGKKSDNRPQKVEGRAVKAEAKKQEKETSKKQESTVKAKEVKSGKAKAVKQQEVQDESEKEDLSDLGESSMEDEEESGEEGQLEGMDSEEDEEDSDEQEGDSEEEEEGEWETDEEDNDDEDSDIDEDSE